MKKNPKKLVLAKETITLLMREEFGQVKGAWIASGSSCTSGNEFFEVPCDNCHW